MNTGKTKEEVLRTEYSVEFDEKRKNAMYLSHFKYGYIKENAELKTSSMIKNIEMRIDKYRETGNTEWLIDVANFAMIEYMYPQHPKAHYQSTDSREGPGLSGMATEEIKRFKEDNTDY